MFAQKKKSIISGKTFALIVIILFAAGYFINTYDFGGKKNDDTTIQSQSGQVEGDTGEESTLVSEGTPASKITSNTQLLMRIYDQITNTTKTQELLMPSEAIGKTFEEARPILLSKYEGCTLREINEQYTLLYKVIEKTPETATVGQQAEEGPEGGAPTEKADYYLIKEDQGVIKVYECDAGGNMKLLKNTQISVNFLGDADQELFRYGVIKHTSEEVNELLQDFES